MLQVPGWTLGLRGEVLGAEALPGLACAWRDLCGRTVEDNVYYAPRYAKALLDSVARNEKVGFAVVWKEAELVALLPFTRPRLAIPGVRAGGRAWQTKYTFSCMPLLDRSQAPEAAGALLDVLASVSRAEWVLPAMNTQGEACRALAGALERRGLPWAFLGRFERAALEAGGTFDEHMKRHVSANRRKGLARTRRRLEELGRVEHRSHSSGEGLDRAVAAFLAIEAAGWKGKRGTALACRADTRRFAMEAFGGGAGDSICRADVLTLDDAPIAVSLVVLAGDTGFAVKGCYDETYRAYSPGLLLEAELVRSFLSEEWARRLDSCTSGAHVLDGLWPGRIEVTDLVFSLARHGAELRLSGLRRSDGIRRSVRAKTKATAHAVQASLRRGSP